MSIVIGAGVAVFYFLASVLFSSWASRKSPAFAQAVVLGGFLARLTTTTVLFYLLWKFFQVKIVDCLIAFIVAYTVLLPITTKVLARDSSQQGASFSARR